MRKAIRTILGAAVVFGIVMGAAKADTSTTRFSMTKPDVGSTNWGPKLNTNFDIIDNAAGLSLANTFTNTNTFQATTLFNSQIRASTGTLSIPAYSFGGAVTTGINNPQASLMDFVVGGTSMMDIGASSITIKVPINVSGNEIDSGTNTFTGGNTFASWTTFTGSQTVTGSTIAYGAAVLNGTRTDSSTTTLAGAVFNGTKTDNSTTTYSGGNTFTGQPLFKNGISVATNTTTGELFGVGATSVTFNSATFNFLGSNTNVNSNAGSLFLHSAAASYNRVIQFSGGVVVNPIIYIPINSDSMYFGATDGTTFSTYTIIAAAGVSIKGTTTNDNAPAGWVGEYISSVTIALTNTAATGVEFNALSISLSAGDWDVSGAIDFNRTGATMTDLDCYMAVSATSGNSAAGEVLGNNAMEHRPGSTGATFTHISLSVPAVRVSIASPTTYYLKGYIATFSAGQPQFGGRISARRIR